MRSEVVANDAARVNHRVRMQNRIGADGCAIAHHGERPHRRVRPDGGGGRNERQRMNAWGDRRRLIEKRKRTRKIVIGIFRYQRGAGKIFQWFGRDDGRRLTGARFRRVLHVGQKSYLSRPGFFNGRYGPNFHRRVASDGAS